MDHLFNIDQVDSAKDYLIKNQSEEILNNRISMMNAFNILDMDKIIVDWANSDIIYQHFKRQISIAMHRIDNRRYEWAIVNIMSNPIIGAIRFVPDIYEMVNDNDDIIKTLSYNQMDFLYIKKLDKDIIDLLILNKVPGFYDKKNGNAWIKLYPYPSPKRLSNFIDIVLHNM